MAKWQAKKVVENQNLLIESSQRGGPDGLRNYYIQKGVQQERDKNHQIVSGVFTALLPFATSYFGNKIVTWFEKRKDKKDADER